MAGLDLPLLGDFTTDVSCQNYRYDKFLRAIDSLILYPKTQYIVNYAYCRLDYQPLSGNEPGGTQDRATRVEEARRSGAVAFLNVETSDLVAIRSKSVFPQIFHKTACNGWDHASAHVEHDVRKKTKLQRNQKN